MNIALFFVAFNRLKENSIVRKFLYDFSECWLCIHLLTKWFFHWVLIFLLKNLNKSKYLNRIIWTNKGLFLLAVCFHTFYWYEEFKGSSLQVKKWNSNYLSFNFVNRHLKQNQSNSIYKNKKERRWKGERVISKTWIRTEYVKS